MLKQNPRTKGARPIDDLLAKLGWHVRDQRAAKGYSQESFADICGIGRVHNRND